LLIGPGGKNIKGIQEATGAKIDIEEDGTVYISHADAAGAEAARAKVEALTEEVRVGKVYEGKVTSIKDFGAFIEIVPGRDGLCQNRGAGEKLGGEGGGGGKGGEKDQGEGDASRGAGRGEAVGEGPAGGENRAGGGGGRALAPACATSGRRPATARRPPAAR